MSNEELLENLARDHLVLKKKIGNLIEQYQYVVNELEDVRKEEGISQSSTLLCGKISTYKKVIDDLTELLDE